jgi:mRNA-degrading endonuclease RelE of RelBE toxin-antitoxin system
MEIIKTRDFNQTFEKLPKEIQRLCITQEKRFIKNWHDPRLHIKKVKALLFALSFRITRRYRVFFYFQDANTAIFFEADHRKDIYRQR